jgi:hypothetical protein
MPRSDHPAKIVQNPLYQFHIRRQRNGVIEFLHKDGIWHQVRDGNINNSIFHSRGEAERFLAQHQEAEK